MNIGLCITGSFCTYSQIKETTTNLINEGNSVFPILSKAVLETDTRFGNAKDFVKDMEDITGNKAVSSIVEAEPFGTNGKLDVLAIAPCTGNTLAKIATGISDDAVTMSAKAHMRNNKPLVIAISTNDALGINMKNIATLLNIKNVYFVPFGQDNPQNKPKSLISDLSLLSKTIESAVKGIQLQPLLLKT